MKRNRTILLLVLAVLVAGLAFLFWRQSKRSYSWREHYHRESKDPYGTSVAYQLLRSSNPSKKTYVLNDSLSGLLPADEALNANYVFVGRTMFIDQENLDALLEFVAAGNNAFLSARNLPYYLMGAINPEVCGSSYYHSWEGFSYTQDTAAGLNLVHPALQLPMPVKFHRRYYKNVAQEAWAFFHYYHFCEHEESMIPLGLMNNDMVNFARVPYEDGFFYLHSTPIAFSNYHLLRPEALAYADAVFSHLGDGPLYWDEYSKNPMNNAMKMPQSKSLTGNSPLQYILSQAPLAWAWYLLLLMGLAYLLIGSRRRQRIVPILEPNTNTSLEFVSTIGRLYFLQNDHRRLTLQKMRLFQQFLRERYGLQSPEADAAFLEKLAAKSEVNRELIDKIFLIHTNILSSNLVTEKTMVQFHGLIEEFYRTCK